MDEGESTHRLSAGQGAPRVYQRRDGRFVVAHDEDGVTWVGDLHLIPRKTALDRYEIALSNARDTLERAVRGAIAAASPEALEAAFATFDYETFHALEALRP